MEPELRIIIAGSRSFRNYEFLCGVLDRFIKLYNTKYHSVVIISGTAKGADSLGEEYAESHNYNLVKFPADWNKYGKSAGYIRNCTMADYAKLAEESHCIVFWDGISRGSKHMINICKDKGIPCLIKLF